MAQITQIVDHDAQALERVREQFKNKTKYTSFLTIFVDQIQDVENALWQLYAYRGIDTAIGTQLDDIGVVVGWPRFGLNDSDYRGYLRARVAVNKSKGTYADVLKVTLAILYGQSPTIKIYPYYPAALEVYIATPAITETQAITIQGFLRSTVAAGVRVLTHWGNTAPGSRFRFAQSAFATGGLSSGATTVAVDSTKGFPVTGSLVIDQGLSVQETVTYNGVTATSFLNTSALAHNHAVNTQVALSRTSEGFQIGGFTSVQEGIANGS